MNFFIAESFAPIGLLPGVPVQIGQILELGTSSSLGSCEVLHLQKSFSFVFK